MGGDDFPAEAFSQIFEAFDKDNSGTIERDEMADFLRQLLNS